MIVRETKTVDSKMRVSLPKNAGIKPGDVVYFETTRSGNIIIKKVESKENGKEKNVL